MQSGSVCKIYCMSYGEQARLLSLNPRPMVAILNGSAKTFLCIQLRLATAQRLFRILCHLTAQWCSTESVVRWNINALFGSKDVFVSAWAVCVRTYA